MVKSLSEFLRKEEGFVQMEEKLIAPVFKQKFDDRTVVTDESSSTKFECIVTGKPSPKVRNLELYFVKDNNLF